MFEQNLHHIVSKIVTRKLQRAALWKSRIHIMIQFGCSVCARSGYTVCIRYMYVVDLVVLLSL